MSTLLSSITTAEPGWWKNEIDSLLDARDAREQAHAEIIEACKADQFIIRFYCGLTVILLDGRIATRITSKQKEASPSDEKGAEGGGEDVSQLRKDLAAAQSSNAKLISENKTLRSQLSDAEANNSNLQEEVTQLRKELEIALRRQKDYEEEAKERGRLTERLQDDLVAAEIELNISAEKMKKLQQDNEMLVQRWMKEKGREAEEMNRAFQ